MRVRGGDVLKGVLFSDNKDVQDKQNTECLLYTDPE